MILMNNQSMEPIIKCQYFEEPLLQFADGREHIDPKIGISRYGPKSLAQNASTRYGTHRVYWKADTIDTAKSWLKKLLKVFYVTKITSNFQVTWKTAGFLKINF